MSTVPQAHCLPCLAHTSDTDLPSTTVDSEKSSSRKFYLHRTQITGSQIKMFRKKPESLKKSSPQSTAREDEEPPIRTDICHR